MEARMRRGGALVGALVLALALVTSAGGASGHPVFQKLVAHPFREASSRPVEVGVRRHFHAEQQQRHTSRVGAPGEPRAYLLLPTRAASALPAAYVAAASGPAASDRIPSVPQVGKQRGDKRPKVKGVRVACPVEPLAVCDFYFEGHEERVPLLKLPGPGKTDVPISPPVRDYSRPPQDPLGLVRVANTGAAHYLCPAPNGTSPDGSNPRYGDDFYIATVGNSAVSQVRNTAQFPGDTPALENRCIMLPLTSAQVVPPGTTEPINLNFGDGNTLYPQRRRCVVFRTGPEAPLCKPTPKRRPQPKPKAKGKRQPRPKPQPKRFPRPGPAPGPEYGPWPPMPAEGPAVGPPEVPDKCFYRCPASPAAHCDFVLGGFDSILPGLNLSALLGSTDATDLQLFMAQVMLNSASNVNYYAGSWSSPLGAVKVRVEVVAVGVSHFLSCLVGEARSILHSLNQTIAGGGLPSLPSRGPGVPSLAHQKDLHGRGASGLLLPSLGMEPKRGHGGDYDHDHEGGDEHGGGDHHGNGDKKGDPGHGDGGSGGGGSGGGHGEGGEGGGGDQGGPPGGDLCIRLPLVNLKLTLDVTLPGSNVPMSWHLKTGDSLQKLIPDERRCIMFKMHS